MITQLNRLVLAAAIAGLGMSPGPVLAASRGIVQKPKLSMQQAREVVLKTYPGGKIMKKELEHESGGSGLRYSFDMKRARHWREVGVDAITGKVLENRAETANPKD